MQRNQRIRTQTLIRFIQEYEILHRTFAELRLLIFQNTELTVEVLFQKEFGDPNNENASRTQQDDTDFLTSTNLHFHQVAISRL